MANGLTRILPRRLYTKGSKPDITGTGPMCKNGMDDNEDEDMWYFPNTELTEIEKRKLIACTMEIAVRAIFSNHLYEFDNKTYLQSDGGPIGVRLAGTVARAIMANWDSTLNKIMAEHNLTVRIISRYVDDIATLLTAIKMGVRWCKCCKKLAYMKEWEEEDRKSNKDNTERTANIIKDMMNSIMKNIQVTVETPNNFDDKTLPILDIRCWVEPLQEEESLHQDNQQPRQKLLYSFFSKPMSSKLCMMKTSAIPEQMKIQTLSNDCIRRQKNVSELLGQEERDKVTDGYASMLIQSGYSKEKTREIITAGLLGYERIRKLEQKGKGRIHRNAAKSLSKKYKKKVIAKSTWYLSKKEKGEGEDNYSSEKAARTKSPPPSNKLGLRAKCGKNRDTAIATSTAEPTVSVLFIPYTVGGELARRLKAAEADLSKLLKDKVKIVEQTGQTMTSLLTKADPSTASCGREKCVVCKDEKQRGKCKARSVTYQTSCDTCSARGREAIYIGESARSVFERSLEHLEDFKKEKDSSHMFAHTTEAHSLEETPKFSIKVLKVHRSALYRQVHEAVMIAN